MNNDADANRGWIGVDLDGTIAHYDGWRGPTHIGAPIPLMVERVKEMLSRGWLVKIFTARAGEPECVAAIEAWCEEHVGQRLQVTATKDYQMIQLWDDRAVQVHKNTGMRADGSAGLV